MIGNKTQCDICSSKAMRKARIKKEAKEAVTTAEPNENTDETTSTTPPPAQQHSNHADGIHLFSLTHTLCRSFLSFIQRIWNQYFLSFMRDLPSFSLSTVFELISQIHKKRPISWLSSFNRPNSVELVCSQPVFLYFSLFLSHTHTHSIKILLIFDPLDFPSTHCMRLIFKLFVMNSQTRTTVNNVRRFSKNSRTLMTTAIGTALHSSRRKISLWPKLMVFTTTQHWFTSRAAYRMYSKVRAMKFYVNFDSNADALTQVNWTKRKKCFNGLSHKRPKIELNWLHDKCSRQWSRIHNIWPFISVSIVLINPFWSSVEFGTIWFRRKEKTILKIPNLTNLKTQENKTIKRKWKHLSSSRISFPKIDLRFVIPSKWKPKPKSIQHLHDFATSQLIAEVFVRQCPRN